MVGGRFAASATAASAAHVPPISRAPVDARRAAALRCWRWSGERNCAATTAASDAARCASALPSVGRASARGLLGRALRVAELVPRGRLRRARARARRARRRSRARAGTDRAAQRLQPGGVAAEPRAQHERARACASASAASAARGARVSVAAAVATPTSTAWPMSSLERGAAVGLVARGRARVAREQRLGQHGARAPHGERDVARLALLVLVLVAAAAAAAARRRRGARGREALGRAAPRARARATRARRRASC